MIIGGTACEIHEENYAQTPRATKDIDIILVVEALSSDFVSHFWEFVMAAGYEQRNKGTNDDVKRFCEMVKSELPNSDFFKSAGLHNITGEQVFRQLELSFFIHD